MILISQIRRDGGTQSRAALNEQTVADYAEAMADENTVFPPVTVYFDGIDHWLADGFHRVAAWERIGREEIPAEVRQGDRRRAILHSVAANSAHGLRRTNEDKRRAVLTLLEDDEWRTWSDFEIARRCTVSREMVAAVRMGLTCGNPQVTIQAAEKIRAEAAAPAAPRTYTTKHGTTATMQAAKIGKTEAPKPAKEPAPEEPAAPTPVPMDPAEAKARREVASMTRQGLEDEVLGLRSENADLRARAKAMKAEIEAMKEDLAALKSDDQGRALGNALRNARAAEGRMKEYQATAVRADRRAKMLEAENASLKAKLQQHEVML